MDPFYDGSVLGRAEPGRGERIVVGPIDVAALRTERVRRHGHVMLSRLWTELYRGYSNPAYERAHTSRNWLLSVDGNNRAILRAKQRRDI